MGFGLWFEAEAYTMTLILLWQTVVSHIISFINIFVTYHKLNVYLFYVLNLYMQSYANTAGFFLNHFAVLEKSQVSIFLQETKI